MLEEKTKILLNYIVSYCSGGGFRIISEQELKDAFSGQYEVCGQELAEIIKDLKENSYIAVKYARSGEFCLMPLPKGKLYQEEQNSAVIREIYLQKTTLKYSFLGGFIGGLIGVILGLVVEVILC